jgi:UDP-N-acetylmuramyl pentapeptide phosphotransferase/UDP-N-acetylglucosamine-1-phosphate transferase
MTVALLVILAFAAAVGGVFLFRKVNSSTPRLLNIPNERSLHRTPVIQGAGSAIVLTVLVFYAISLTGYAINWAYVITALSVAIVGFVDDFFAIPQLPRFVVHVAAATVLVWACDSYERLVIPGLSVSVEFGSLSAFITVGFIIWVTNAYNFMDGIDGIAGVQGVAAGLGWMLAGLINDQPAMAAIGAILSGACLGFLIFNWQPATVFMGDVGSNFLGFTLATIPLITTEASTKTRNEGFVLAAVFLWLFLFDTVFTRLLLLVKLSPFWRPHKEHLYQQIVVAGTSHRAVSTFFGIVALLAAIAVSLIHRAGPAPLAVILIGSPLVLLLFARKKRLT